MKNHYAAISLALASAFAVPMGSSFAQMTTTTPASIKPVTAATTAPATTTPSIPGTTTVAIKAGKVINAKLTKKISTANAHDQDTFTLKESNPLFGGNSLLKGAVIEGHIEDVVKAQRGKKASLHLVFDDIVFKNKQVQVINATLVNTKLEKQTQGTMLRNVAILTAGAVAGHYLGHKVGLPNGTGVTSAAAFVLTSPGGEVVINKGTDFKLKLNSDLLVKNVIVKK